VLLLTILHDLEVIVNMFITVRQKYFSYFVNSYRWRKGKSGEIASSCEYSVTWPYMGVIVQHLPYCTLSHELQADELCNSAAVKTKWMFCASYIKLLFKLFIPIHSGLVVWVKIIEIVWKVLKKQGNLHFIKFYLAITNYV
jgi:hypothetical protein